MPKHVCDPLWPCLRCPNEYPFMFYSIFKHKVNGIVVIKTEALGRMEQRDVWSLRLVTIGM